MMKKNPLQFFKYIVAVYALITLVSGVLFLFMYGNEEVEVTGTISPLRYQIVSPVNSGVLKEKLVKDGDMVKKGQLLAVMDDEVFARDFEIKQLEMESLMNLHDLTVKRKDLIQSNHGIMDKKFDLEKYSIEQKYKSRIITYMDYINLLYQLQLNRIQTLQTVYENDYELVNYKKQIETKRIELDNLQRRINQCRLSAALDGMVIDPDDLISEGRVYSPSDPVLSIYSSDKICADILIPENKMSKIEINQKVTLLINALPYTKYKVFKGVLVEIKKSAAKNASAYQGKVEIQDPYFIIKNNEEQKKKKLLYGMTLIARINTGKINFLHKFLKLE